MKYLVIINIVFIIKTLSILPTEEHLSMLLSTVQQQHFSTPLYAHTADIL